VIVVLFFAIITLVNKGGYMPTTPLNKVWKRALDFLSPKELNRVLLGTLNRSRGTLRAGQKLAIGSQSDTAKISVGYLKKVFDYKKAQVRADGKGGIQNSINTGHSKGNISIFKFKPTTKKIPLKPLSQLKRRPKKGKRRKANVVVTDVLLPGNKRISYGTNKTNYLFANRKKTITSKGLGHRRSGSKRRPKKGNVNPGYLKTGQFNLAYWLVNNNRAFRDTYKYYVPQFFKTFKSNLDYVTKKKRSKIIAKMVIRGSKF
jgi:hypothetical protein